MRNVSISPAKEIFQHKPRILTRMKAFETLRYTLNTYLITLAKHARCNVEHLLFTLSAIYRIILILIISNF